MGEEIEISDQQEATEDNSELQRLVSETEQKSEGEIEEESFVAEKEEILQIEKCNGLSVSKCWWLAFEYVDTELVETLIAHHKASGSEKFPRSTFGDGNVVDELLTHMRREHIQY